MSHNCLHKEAQHSPIAATGGMDHIFKPEGELWGEGGLSGACSAEPGGSEFTSITAMTSSTASKQLKSCVSCFD